MENSKIVYAMLQQRLTNPVFTVENVLQPKPNSGAELYKYKERILNLSADQAELTIKVLTGDDDVITCIGEAGSGKSYTLKLIRDISRDCFNVKVVVVSAMGICAHNVEGQTLHSTFGIKRSYPLPKEINYMLGKVKDPNEKPIHGEAYREKVSSIAYRALSKLTSNDRDILIILDEFATTPSQYLIAMHQIVRICRPNGNIKWLLIGDPNQALMVDTGSKVNVLNYPWEDAIFINGPTEQDQIVYSSLMHKGPFLKGKEQKWKSSYFALLCNHRQGKEFDFINSLRTVSKGIGINSKSILNSRLMKELPPELDLESCTFIFASNKKAQAHNKYFFDKASEKQVYKALITLEGVTGYIEKYDPANYYFTLIEKVTGVEYEFQGKNYYWLFNLTTPVINPIYNGQRFMITENNSERKLFNGMVGKVVALGKDSIKVKFASGEYWINPTPEINIPEDKQNKPIANIKRIPGVSANAITCNKSLGKTFNEPTVLVLNKFQWPQGVKNSGWVYVALSRVTSLDKLYILCEDSKNLITHRSLLNSLIYTEPSCSAFVENVNNYVINSDETSLAVKQLIAPSYSVSLHSGHLINEMIKLNLSVVYSYRGISETYNISAWTDPDRNIVGYEDYTSQYTDDFSSLPWHSPILSFLKDSSITIDVSSESAIHLDFPRELITGDPPCSYSSLKHLLLSLGDQPTELLENLAITLLQQQNVCLRYAYTLISSDPSTDHICSILNAT